MEKSLVQEAFCIGFPEGFGMVEVAPRDGHRQFAVMRVWPTIYYLPEGDGYVVRETLTQARLAAWQYVFAGEEGDEL